MALKFKLVTKCHNHVDDPAGSWIIEGGELRNNLNKHIGNYSAVARTSCTIKVQECAQLWMTLFFFKKHPPENMTLHGAFGYGGGSSGSVSAATPPFMPQIGRPFTRVGSILTIL